MHNGNRRWPFLLFRRSINSILHFYCHNVVIVCCCYWPLVTSSIYFCSKSKMYRCWRYHRNCRCSCLNSRRFMLIDIGWLVPAIEILDESFELVPRESLVYSLLAKCTRRCVQQLSSYKSQLKSCILDPSVNYNYLIMIKWQWCSYLSSFSIASLNYCSPFLFDISNSSLGSITLFLYLAWSRRRRAFQLFVGHGSWPRKLPQHDQGDCRPATSDVSSDDTSYAVIALPFVFLSHNTHSSIEFKQTHTIKAE